MKIGGYELGIKTFVGLLLLVIVEWAFFIMIMMDNKSFINYFVVIITAIAGLLITHCNVHKIKDDIKGRKHDE